LAVLYSGIENLYTLERAVKKEGRRPVLKDLTQYKDGCVLVEKGRVLYAGTLKVLKGKKELYRLVKKTVDLNVKVVLPGFVECHTHSVFAGSRAHEFELRNQGATYQEISRAGGGILSTVKSTRKASETELSALYKKRVDRFISQGVVALEVKSGYGLDYKTEAKMLRVAAGEKRIPITRTYLGAHSVPKGKSLETYFDEVLSKDLPKIAKEKLADRVDIFVEGGFFTPDQCERLFDRAKELGLNCSCHVDQLSYTKGAGLAIKKGAQSIDHAVHLKAKDFKALAKSNTVSVGLPGADFYLHEKYPNARKVIDEGGRFALATDFNPGSSPTQSLNFVGVLARLEMKMTLPEVIVSYTLNAAQALGVSGHLGHLSQGADASFVGLDCHLDELFYEVGFHPVKTVFSRGKKLV
jgi:imidazolonepropionase